MHDQKRAVAEKKKGAAVADTEYWIWDFVMEREYGTYAALHSNYANTKVECRFHLPTPDNEIPNNGAGGTNGPGVVRYPIRSRFIVM